MINSSQNCLEKQRHWASSFAFVPRDEHSNDIPFNFVLTLVACIGFTVAAHAT